MTDPLFFNPIDASHYTVADVLASVTNVTTSVSAKVDDIAARVLALQTRLATTDQNDLRSSIQSFKDTITSMSAMITTINVELAGQAVDLAKFREVAQDIPAVAASATVVVTVPYGIVISTPAAVTVSLESDGHLSLLHWTRNPDGSGILATVVNDTHVGSVGTLHVIARVL